MKISTKQIGDGKLPNKYWVSISEDYYYYQPDKDGAYLTWLGDLDLFEPKGKTIQVFDTYQEAREFVEDIIFDYAHDDIHVNSIFIEDRLSGQVFEKVKAFSPEHGQINTFHEDDVEFTRKEMEKRGESFK